MSRSLTSLPFGLAACAVAIALHAPARAQCEPSTGFFFGTPLGLSIADGSVPGVGGADLRFKEHGARTTVPGQWPNQAGFPTLRLEDILAATVCNNLGAPLPDVDAISMGEDFILVDANGVLAVPRNRWGAITLSVTTRTRGARGSVIAAEVARPGGAAADLFTYVLHGSALPAELVGVTDRSLDQDEIDLGADGDIDALDLFAPTTRQLPAVTSELLSPIEIYFSVSPATIPRVPAVWWGGTPRSAATIFLVRENPFTGGFTCPRVWRRFDQLGLAQSEDIDALSYDKRQCKLLFSTKTRGRNQILYLDPCLDGRGPNPVPVVDTSGTPITTNIGILEEDDVDAICTLDPSVRRGGGRVNNITYFTMGSPMDRLVRFPGRVDAGAFRHLEGVGDAYTTWLTGWTPSGPQRGFGVLFANFPAAPGLFVVDVVNRDPAALGCRGATRYRLPIPPALPPFTSTVDLIWVAVTADFGEATDAWPIRIHF